VSEDPGRAAPRGCWFGRVEIPAADPRRAADFYRRVFGWTDDAVAGADGAYLALRGTAAPDGSTAGAGIATPAQLGSPHPLAVIHVAGERLDAVLARVTAAGGSVDLAPTAVAGHGTFARFRDPGGNLLGLWRAAPNPSSSTPHPAPPAAAS